MYDDVQTIKDVATTVSGLSQPIEALRNKPGGHEFGILGDEVRYAYAQAAGHAECVANECMTSLVSAEIALAQIISDFRNNEEQAAAEFKNKWEWNR